MGMKTLYLRLEDENHEDDYQYGTSVLVVKPKTRADIRRVLDSLYDNLHLILGSHDLGVTDPNVLNFVVDHFSTHEMIENVEAMVEIMSEPFVLEIVPHPHNTDRRGESRRCIVDPLEVFTTPIREGKVYNGESQATARTILSVRRRI